MAAGEASHMGELRELALRLYDLGFNVVPVDSQKRPLASWSPDKRLERAELEKLLEKAEGVAVVAGLSPWSVSGINVILLDIDDPRVLERSSKLRRWVESTVHWLTGPRCPECYSKRVERVEAAGGRLRCGDCGRVFEASGVPRGVGAIFSASDFDIKDILRGTLRFKGVEILVRNYQLIPPSVHRTGVRYEWVKPFDFESGDLGIHYLEDAQLAELVKEASRVSGAVAEAEVEVRAEAEFARPSVEVREKPRLRELSDREVEAAKEVLRKIYKVGWRQLVWLYFAGACAKAGVSPVSAARVLKSLYEEGDSDSLATRGSALVYTYKKHKVDVLAFSEELKSILGAVPYGLEKEIGEESVKGLQGLREVASELLGEEEAERLIRRLSRVLGVKVSSADVLSVPVEDIPDSVRKYARRRSKANPHVVIAKAVARYIAATRHIKTPVDLEDREIGVYCYHPEGYYKPCYRSLLAEADRLCEEWGIADRIGNYLTFQKVFLEYLMSITRHEGGLNHHLVLFKNGVLSWKCLLFNGGSQCLKKPSPDFLVVHRVPWEVDVGVLSRSFSSRGELSGEIESDPDMQDIVKVFKQWVGDAWLVLFEVIGYTFLAGAYPMHKAIMLYGEGANGKSTFLNLVIKLLGEENVSYVCLPDLAGENRFAASQLFGKMANVCADLPEFIVKEAGTFKRLVGYDVINADRKFKEPIAFRNYAKLLFSTNVLPRVKDMSEAFWDRWVLLWFPNRFPRSHGFEEWFFGELLPRVAPKLIAYSIHAILQVLRSQTFTAGQEDLKEIWLKETNSIYAFLKEMLRAGVLEEDKKARVDAEWLYDRYVEFCNAEDIEAESKTAFTIWMRRKGYPKVRVKRTSYYKGLRLVDPNKIPWSSSENE